MMTDRQSAADFPPHSVFPLLLVLPDCNALVLAAVGRKYNTKLGLGIHTGNKSIQHCDSKL